MLSVISPFDHDKSLTYLTPNGEELTLLHILSGTPSHLYSEAEMQFLQINQENTKKLVPKINR